MPALMALGMLANPIGLILAVQFILLATLLLVQDSFPFYPFGAPTGPATPKTPREVEDASDRYPSTPEAECPPLECELLTRGLDIPHGVDIQANIRLARSHRVLNPLYGDNVVGLAVGAIPGVSAVLAARDSGNLLWFWSQVETGGKWDYKGLPGGDFEPFGNFHFGVVSAAMDLRIDVALHGAGAYQIYSFARDVVGREIPGSPVQPPFGDDHRDSAWIARGYAWYQLCAN